MGKFTVGLCDDALSHFGNTDDLTFLVYLRLSHTKLPKLLDYLDSYSLVSQMQRGDWNWTARVAFFALSATGTVFYRCCAPTIWKAHSNHNVRLVYDCIANNSATSYLQI